MVDLARSPDICDIQSYQTTELRYSVLLAAKLDGDELAGSLSIRIVNISAGGLMAILPTGCKVDGPVVVTIRHLGELNGQIAWSKSNKVGIKLDREIDPMQIIVERAQRLSPSSDVKTVRKGEQPVRIIRQIRNDNASNDMKNAAIISAQQSGSIHKFEIR